MYTVRKLTKFNPVQYMVMSCEGTARAKELIAFTEERRAVTICGLMNKAYEKGLLARVNKKNMINLALAAVKCQELLTAVERDKKGLKGLPETKPTWVLLEELSDLLDSVPLEKYRQSMLAQGLL